MKKCPTCKRTFDDSIRFCQTDGTPLVNAVEGAAETFPPKSDSTFSVGESSSQTPFENQSSSPVSSPIDNSEPSFKEREPMFDEPQPSFNQSPFGNSSSTPFDNQAESYNPPFQQSEWNPPPAPMSEWQNQNTGANTPFQSPVSGQGEDKTLAIVSLVCGILSVTCCGAITGIAALVTGNMAKNNVDANPQQYGGRGLALAGMIMGGISLIMTVIGLILFLIGGIFR